MPLNMLNLEFLFLLLLEFSINLRASSPKSKGAFKFIWFNHILQILDNIYSLLPTCTPLAPSSKICMLLKKKIVKKNYWAW